MVRSILRHYSAWHDYFWLEYCIDDAKIVIERACRNYAVATFIFLVNFLVMIYSTISFCVRLPLGLQLY